MCFRAPIAVASLTLSPPLSLSLSLSLSFSLSLSLFLSIHRSLFLCLFLYFFLFLSPSPLYLHLYLSLDWMELTSRAQFLFPYQFPDTSEFSIATLFAIFQPSTFVTSLLAAHHPSSLFHIQDSRSQTGDRTRADNYENFAPVPITVIHRNYSRHFVFRWSGLP